MGETEGLLLAVVIVLVVIALERCIARWLLIPCSRVVTWVSDKIFYFFIWIQKLLGERIRQLRDGTVKKWNWVKRLDAIDDAKALRPFGGIWKLLTMAFCLAVTVIVFVVLTVTHSGKDISGDLLVNLPVFAWFDVFFEKPFAYEALLQLALFSVLSVGFMERNAETTNGVVTAVYDLIFTGFCTCVLYVVPQAFYRVPVTVVAWCRSFTAVCSEMPVVNVLVWIVAIPLFVIMGYVIICTYLLALREVLESLAYSLIPLTLFFVSFAFLQILGVSGRLLMILCFVLLLLCCWLVGVCRVRGKNRKPHERNARFRLFRRRS